jgi:hypothetical protein
MPNQVIKLLREASIGFGGGHAGTTTIGMIVEWMSAEGVASSEFRGPMRMCPAPLR